MFKLVIPQDDAARAAKFDELTGLACLEGTLTIQNLLAIVRASVVKDVAVDMDTYAHCIFGSLRRSRDA